MTVEQRQHKAQLNICHELIAAPDFVATERQWCHLRPAAWCWDCDHYVCSIHLVSRHDMHDTSLT